MGCDIHLFIEYKNHVGNWVCFGDEMNPGRMYEMFAKMAGVRDYEGIMKFKPRGLPENYSSEVESGAHYFISEHVTDEYEDRRVSPSKAEEMVSKGWAKRHPTKDFYVTVSDWHNHSWLTADELESCMTDLNIPAEHEKWFVEYRAVVAAMRVFEKAGYETRVVFWFDN